MNDADLTTIQSELELLHQQIVRSGEDMKALHASVTRATSNLNNSLAECLTPIRTSLAEIPELCDEARQLIDRLSAEGQPAVELLSTLHDEIESQVEQWEESHVAAMDDAREALSLIEDGVDETETEFKELMDNAEARLLGLRDELIEQVAEEIIEPVNEAREEMMQRINDMLDQAVDDILPSKADEVVDEWIANLRTELDKIIEEVREGLSEFRQVIIHGSDEAGNSRQTSEIALEALRTAFAPVLQELDRVRSLAGTVGISI